MSDINYWIVGAADGTDHQDQLWIKQGIWKLGYNYSGNHNAKDQIDLSSQIKKLEIESLVKRMLGGKRIGIRVLHIGIIKGVISDPQEDRCPLFTVEWLATDLDRILEGGKDKGNPQLPKSIHGPIQPSDWREMRLFSL